MKPIRILLTFSSHRFCGLSKEGAGQLEGLEMGSPYWMYRFERPDQPGKWTKIHCDPSPPYEPSSTSQGEFSSVPHPRFAHQVVYDIKTKTVYMHGGNGGLGKDETYDDGPDIATNYGPSGSGNAGIVRVTAGLPTRTEEGRDVPMEGVSGTPEKDNLRLDDFWTMQLKRFVPGNDGDDVFIAQVHVQASPRTDCTTWTISHTATTVSYIFIKFL